MDVIDQVGNKLVKLYHRQNLFQTHYFRKKKQIWAPFQTRIVQDENNFSLKLWFLNPIFWKWLKISNVLKWRKRGSVLELLDMSHINVDDTI